jgi:hypothetical protein
MRQSGFLLRLEQAAEALYLRQSCVLDRCADLHERKALCPAEWRHNRRTIMPGPSVRASEEVNGLLRDQGKDSPAVLGLLGATGIGRGAGSLPAELYWELLDANDHGVVTLGASYSRGGAGGTYQSADVLYYASGGYYVALTLHQLWPVTVDGKPSTLVWRGDMISSAELGHCVASNGWARNQ